MAKSNEGWCLSNHTCPKCGSKRVESKEHPYSEDEDCRCKKCKFKWTFEVPEW